MRKLTVSTMTSEMLSIFSFVPMAIPRDHLAPRWAFGGPPGRKRALRLNDWPLRLRLRRFVADQPHFAEQVGNLHAGERFEERGHLRGDSRDVSGQFISAGSIAIACGNDGHLVYLAERLGKSAHDIRQSRKQLVDDGGPVVFPEGP